MVLDTNPVVIVIESQRGEGSGYEADDVDITEPHHLTSLQNFKDKNDESPESKSQLPSKKYLDSKSDQKSRSSKLTPSRAPYRNSTNHASQKHMSRSKSVKSDSFLKQSKGSKSTRPSTAYGLNHNQSHSDAKSLSKSQSKNKRLTYGDVRSGSREKSVKQKEAERDL